LTWQIDKQKGVATLEPGDYKGPRLELPLRPMLGCIGTAPANNAAIPTSNPDNFGGNMDYNGMGEGVTVMLPVFEPGALLFLGDGHGRQGDGEVTGGAIETSLDVDTTELMRWLMADYGFDERGASLLLGQAMEFEISNVVDPEFTIVAKMRKRFLGQR